MSEKKKDFILMRNVDVLGLIELYEHSKGKQKELHDSLHRLFMVFQMNQKLLEEYKEMIEKYDKYYENLFSAYKELKEEYDEVISWN